MVWFGATSWEAKEPLPEIEITGEEGQAFALTLPDDLVEVFRREAERDL